MKNPFNLTSSRSYQWNRRLAGAAMLAVMSFSIAHARTWTSSDGGKTFEGDLTSYDPATGMVGVKLANGSVMNFNREKLAAADLAFLKEQGATSPAPASSGGVSAADVPEALPDPDDSIAPAQPNLEDVFVAATHREPA